MTIVTNDDCHESQPEQAPIIAKNCLLEKRNRTSTSDCGLFLPIVSRLDPRHQLFSRSPSLALQLPKLVRSNSFPGPRNSYPGNRSGSSYFERFTDGMRFAISQNRRSGAQRGASENNFGQRFSVSTPCFSCSVRQPSPPYRSRKMRASLDPQEIKVKFMTAETQGLTE